MCGIVGFMSGSVILPCDEWSHLLQQMGEAIRLRGPDDDGVWVDKHAGVGLGHRRLSILDLSSAGHQPMASASGRYVMVFNGEIYNHLELRQELGCIRWRGHSDTETLLAGFEAWGIEATLKKAVGMFAIALWDKAEHMLTLARDRIGEKPLYYGWQGSGNEQVFLFGSQLKALRVHPLFKSDIDRNALCLLLRHAYIPAPYSIYKGIYRLIPGTVLSIHYDKLNGGNELPEPVPYWSLRTVVESGITEPFLGSDEEAINELDRLLRQSVCRQMVADVPLGAFLSGGIDSSTIVAIMQAQSNRPIKTFTIGFNESEFNEAEDAKAVSMHLGTEHRELFFSSQDAMDIISRLPECYDEPFADSSQIPTFMVSQFTRRHVSVSLSGDGGDELFGGYNQYLLGQSIWNKLKLVPRTLRSIIAGSISSVSPQRWDEIYKAISFILPAKLRVRMAGDKLHKLMEVIDKESPEAFYRELISLWKSPSSIVLDSHEPPTVITDNSQWTDMNDFVLRMMYLDSMTYLPDDILVKVDRAAMGVSLETRVPFLDHNVVEFAWKLPVSLKIRNGQSKWILRQVLYKYVPAKLIDRPKMGFGVPIDTWLCGPLRDWAESLLNSQRIREEGFFNPDPIREKWNEHLSGKRKWHYHLWNVLMFQAWLEAQK
ncbi:asparagine synthase (glutamine-hydrolyzing) [bacterium]|nr:asparagine synthase (glutamine-hydrolyzing) [bacterium]